MRTKMTGLRGPIAARVLAGLLALLCICFTIPIQARISVAESPLFTIDTGGRVPAVGSGISASDSASGHFTIDTRGGAASFANSAFFTIDTRGAVSLALPVQVVDGLGRGLSDVTITVRQNGIALTTGTTAANGSALLAALHPGYYEVRAERSGYLTQARYHFRLPEDLAGTLRFVMTAAPLSPGLVESAAPPAASLLGETSAASSSTQLRSFRDGGFRVPAELERSKMTIVLTHGCDSNTEAWPTRMAGKLADVSGLVDRANIVAWDWQEAAEELVPGVLDCGLCTLCSKPRQATREQGLALGRALYEQLGSDYAKPLHFLGHSLGTLVNATAADYLHGHDSSQKPATAWSWEQTHVTVFDTAALLPELRLDWIPVWGSALPQKAKFIENYLGFSGDYYARAVNVFLQKSKGLSPARIHRYPMEWYEETIDNPGGSLLGFQWSFEQLGDGARFPVPGLYSEGALFVQDEVSTEPQALVQLIAPEGLRTRQALEVVSRILPLEGGAVSYSLKTAQGVSVLGTWVLDQGSRTVRKIGEVTVAVGETVLDHYGGTLNPQADPLYGVGNTTPAVIDIPGFAGSVSPVTSWSLDILMRTVPAFLGARGATLQGLRAAGAATEGEPAYVWIPVEVPANAVALVFDFTLTGEVADDRLVAGIHTNNLFNVPAGLLALGERQSSGPLPIAPWAGQSTELFFGMTGGTSTNAEVQIQAIRFLGEAGPVVSVDTTVPDLEPIGDETIAAEGLLTFTAQATTANANAQSLTFSLDPGAPEGANIEAKTGVFTWTPTLAQTPSTNLITIRVTDDTSERWSTAETITVVVLAPNSPPILGEIADRTVDEGVQLSFSATATDGDLPRQGLTFNLEPDAPAGAAIDPATGVFTWTPTEAQGSGTQVIRVKVTDNGVPSLSATNQFTVIVNEVNSPPILVPISDQIVSEGTQLSFVASSTDADLPVQTLIFALEPGAPSGATIDAATGAFSWTPTEEQGPSTNQITVRVTDNGGPSLSDIKTFTVVVNEVNSPPVIVPIADRFVEENSKLEFKVEATDSDIPKNALTFAFGFDAPVGAILDPQTGVFTWIAGEVTATQTNKVSVRVMDDGSPPMGATNTFLVVITPSPMRLAPIPGRSDDEGAVITLTATVMDSPLARPPLTFALEPGAPEGALINPASGAFLWQPTEAQGPSTNRITVRVTDSSSPPLTATRSFTNIVREVNRPPVLEAIPPQSVTAGQLLNLTVKAQDPDLPSNELTYSLEASAPAGASIHAQTGLFSWTPGPVAAGTINSITVKLTDNGSPALSHTAVFTVVVTPPPPLKLMGSFLPDGQFQLTLSGEVGRIYLIQASTDLAVWEPVTNILSTAATIRIVDPAVSSFRQRFYRALSP